jgi:hypothetical protein
MTAHVLAVRCNWCSKQRPEFRVHRIVSGQVICDDCLDWHQRALEMLAGYTPPGCQKCGVSWAHLADSTPGVEVRMYVVPKEGIYQLLCAACVRPYAAKRADLYGGTEFGNTLKTS